MLSVLSGCLYYGSKVSVEQELTVVVGMHILEHKKAHRCTDQLTI